MDRFFKGEGRALVQREVERMKNQVIFIYLLLLFLNGKLADF